MIENVSDWSASYTTNSSLSLMNICRIWNAEIHSKTNSSILEARLAAAELMTVSPKLYNRPSEVSFHVLSFFLKVKYVHGLGVGMRAYHTYRISYDINIILAYKW